MRNLIGRKVLNSPCFAGYASREQVFCAAQSCQISISSQRSSVTIPPQIPHRGGPPGDTSRITAPPTVVDIFRILRFASICTLNVRWEFQRTYRAAMRQTDPPLLARRRKVCGAHRSHLRLRLRGGRTRGCWLCNLRRRREYCDCAHIVFQN